MRKGARLRCSSTPKSWAEHQGVLCIRRNVQSDLVRDTLSCVRAPHVARQSLSDQHTSLLGYHSDLGRVNLTAHKDFRYCACDSIKAPLKSSLASITSNHYNIHNNYNNNNDNYSKQNIVREFEVCRHLSPRWRFHVRSGTSNIQPRCPGS